MARYECERCHVVCFTTDPPHLCKDVAARYRRFERQVAAVIDILKDHVRGSDEHLTEVSGTIVARLNQLGITED